MKNHIFTLRSFFTLLLLIPALAIFGQARIQVIHNSADAAASEVDVWLNDGLLIDNFAFRTASPFIDAPAGVDFDVVIQPANSTDTTNALARFTYNLTDGETYVLVANGIVVPDGYNPATPFDIYVYPMGRESATNPANTDLLVFHGSTDAPVVDVVEVGVGAGTIVDDLAYSAFAGYLELPTLDFSLQIRDQTGTTTIAQFDAPLATLNLNGVAAVVVASGFLDPSINNNGPAFGLYVALPSGGDLVALPSVPISTARLQVIHNSADAAAAEVDVWLNDVLLIDNFAFRTASPFIDAPAGVDFDVVIQPANSTDTTNALARFTYNLAGGSKYVLVANGIVVPAGYNPATPFDIYVYGMGQEAANSPENSDVLVFHGSTDAPTVDVVETGVGAGTIVDNLSYGEFAGYLELPTDDYVLAIRDESGTVTVAMYQAPLATLGLQGAAMTVVASGFLNPAVNNDGAAFGLFVALPSGGALVELPVYTPSARLQVIHNSADAAAAEVDVWLNDVLLIDNFAFRTASPFIDAPAGVDFDVVIQPANSTDTTNALARFTYNLMDGETYVLVANGIVVPTGYNPATPFDIYVYGMGQEAANSPDNSDVLVFHGSTDAPTVDVVETGVGAGTIVDDLSYGEFAGYLELPTDDYVLAIRDETGTVTVAMYQAPLATLGLQGAAMTVVASGFLNPAVNNDGAAFGLFVALPSGGALVELPVYTPSARLQVIHNSADAAAAEVDVWLNDALLIDNFAFRTASPFIDAPAGVDFDVVIQPANSTDTTNALARFTYNLMDGETYVLVANGIVVPAGYNPATPFDIYVYGMGQEAANSPENTDVLVFHGSTDAPTVDIVEVGVGAGTIVDNISYGEFAGYLELPAADYRIQVRDASGANVVAEYLAPLATLGLNGAAAVAVASGFLDPSSNNNGEAFGIFVALPSGGPLVALPAVEISTARLQVIHNSADAAAAEVDVWLNDALLIDNFAFRTATPFIDAPAGVDFDVVIQPANSTDTTNALARFTYNLAGGEKYMLIANGIVVPTGYNPATPFDLYPLGGAREVASNSSNTDIVAFHGSTDAPTVDVVEIGVGAGTIIDNLSYGNYAGYLELPTADYVLEVRDETGTVTVASYSAPLATLGLNGQALAVVASGFLNPGNNNNGAAFGLFVALPSGGALIPLPVYIAPTARVQVMHNAADAAASEVDVWLNNVLLIDNFAFRTASPFIDAPAGVDFDVVIQPANSTDTTNALARFTYNLESDKKYILIANGIVSASGYSPVQPFDIYVYDMAREEATASSNTDVLVFHGATDAPVVDIVEVFAGAGTIVDNLSYGAFAGYLELPTANYQLDIRNEAGDVTVATFNAPLADFGLQGQALAVLASGFLSPGDNSNGAGFGLFAVLPSGGNFIPLGNTTGINENALTSGFLAYPNPSNGVMNISFNLSKNSLVSYSIYNATGRLVKETALGTLPSGSYKETFDVSNLMSGFYLVKLVAGNSIVTSKIQVVN
ncbi:MAG: hypothetical protein CVT94_03935 [Bacteroidetes bacterium HGW-Bacteroidetes-11]|nr:MAG: hypothetical protein CVT94_03935 [Bacteroidetes bacterium HGW-Bacteroidetes-11]